MCIRDRHYPTLLSTRYKLDISQLDGIALLEAIAQKRGYRRDGLLDMERTAMAFLTDFRSGTIGRISLETPQSRAEMIKQTETVKTKQKDTQADAS